MLQTKVAALLLDQAPKTRLLGQKAAKDRQGVLLAGDI